MGLTLDEREACLAYLRGARHSGESVARLRLAALLIEAPEEAAKLFHQAVGAILLSKSITDETARSERLLGFVERLFSTMLDQPRTGWDAIRRCVERVLPALPPEVVPLFPMKSRDWASRDFLPVYRAFTVDFRARATAGSLRLKENPGALNAFIMDTLHSAEEKRVFVAVVKDDLTSTDDLAPDAAQFVATLEKLPLVKRKQTYSSVFLPAESPMAAAGPVLLLIEPNEPIRRTLKMGLADAKYRVSEASNGCDAETFLRAAPPALVIMELRLPGVSGLSILSTLRAGKPPVPVVAMSLTEAMAKEFEVTTYPKIRFLKKPITFTPVLEAVKALLKE